MAPWAEVLVPPWVLSPRRTLLTTLILTLFALATGCFDAPPAAPWVAPPPLVAPPPPVATSFSLESAVASGRRLDEVEGFVQRLAARNTPEALARAGSLLARRFEGSHAPSDLARSLDFLRSASSRDPEGLWGCTAAGRLAGILESERRGAEAASARDAYESHCVPPPLRRSTSVTVGSPRAAPRGERPRSVRRVMLDPGHGGSDPGAVGPTGLRESEVTLDVARRVAERLALRYGMQAVLTRDRDDYVDLEDRAAHANDSGADVFVSIHCNAAHNPFARGISTFVLEHTNDRVAARVAAREGELIDTGVLSAWDLSRILTDLRLSQHGRNSLQLARSLQDAMLHDARLLYPAVDDMGVHPARFQVLVTARMPAVLVELSFISNAGEERRLRDDGYRDVLAGAIARALADPG